MKRTTERSYLFVPGHRPERFDKAVAAGAHAVIIDLEDAVPVAEKADAREHVASWLTPDRPVYVRVNGPGTEWFQDDVALCRMPGVAGVMLPKAEGVEDVRRFAGQCPVIPLIETAAGLWGLEPIAREPGVLRLAFGSLDFQSDLGVEGDHEELLYYRSRLVLLSRVAGLQPPVDGVSVAIHDQDALRADVLRARRMGFGGKLCIHPAQVATVNEAFLPDEEAVTWARRVIEAARAADGGAVSVDGRMVDRPVMARARRILLEAEGE